MKCKYATTTKNNQDISLSRVDEHQNEGTYNMANGPGRGALKEVLEESMSSYELIVSNATRINSD